MTAASFFTGEHQPEASAQLVADELEDAESVRALEDLVAAIAADPLAVRLSRLTEIQYANVLARPLLRAGYADDTETLGKLLPKLHGKLDPRHGEAFVEYLELLAANDLLRTDRQTVINNYLDSEPIRGVAREEIDQSNRGIAREVELGSGVSF